MHPRAQKRASLCTGIVGGLHRHGAIAENRGSSDEEMAAVDETGQVFLMATCWNLLLKGNLLRLLQVTTDTAQGF